MPVACDAGPPSMFPQIVRDDCGVFVTADAVNDLGDGTKVKPFKLLASALAAAAAGSKRVFACSTSIATFQESVTVPAGVALYGGLDCGNAWAYDAAKKAKLQGPANAIALTVTGGGASTSVEDFTITAADATITGGSSIAVLLNGGTIELTRVDATAGNAMDGADGASGGAQAAQANGGGNGADQCANGFHPGGKGGTNTCMGTNLKGGDGGNGAFFNPVTMMNAPLGVGSAGDGGLGGSGGTFFNVPAAGGAGTAGNPGLSGYGGGKDPADNRPLGALDLTGFHPRDGEDGGDGTHGTSGGGGCGQVAEGSCSEGPAGGGGGAGGCGGLHGTKGTGAGSSLALVSLGASATLTSVTLVAKAGGKGGKGGKGQLGQPGGAHGVTGNLKDAILNGYAGDGGDGGNGGDGGGGGGGRGGHSIALAYTGAAPAEANVTKMPGSAGLGGTGGSASNAGLDGVAAPAQAFP